MATPLSADPKLPNPGPMRRVGRNFGLLLRGRWIAGLMAFAATTLMARALGPSDFGVVVLLQAYVFLVRGIIDFQPFEAVVRFGVALHDQGNQHELSRLTKLCLRVDHGSALVAAAVAVVLAPVAGNFLDLGHTQVLILATYSLSLLATGNGTAMGLLRLYDRFDVIGKQMLVGPLIRVIGVGIAFAVHAELTTYIVIWAVAYVIENLFLNWCGWREYQAQISTLVSSDDEPRAKLAEFAGLREFLWVTYWQSTLDLVPKHLSMLMAGAMLGSAGAGLLRLAREYSSLLAKPAVLIRQVVFPDLTRSWQQRSADFEHVTWRTAWLGGAFGLLFVVFGLFAGAAVLTQFVGPAFAVAAPVLTLMLLAAAFNLAAAPLRAATYAMGHAGAVLRLHGIASVVYLLMFVGLVPWLGLNGAGIATVAAALIPLFGMALLIRQLHYTPRG